jgi:hypothetical protein
MPYDGQQDGDDDAPAGAIVCEMECPGGVTITVHADDDRASPEVVEKVRRILAELDRPTPLDYYGAKFPPPVVRHRKRVRILDADAFWDKLAGAGLWGFGAGLVVGIVATFGVLSLYRGLSP